MRQTKYKNMTAEEVVKVYMRRVNVGRIAALTVEILGLIALVCIVLRAMLSFPAKELDMKLVFWEVFAVCLVHLIYRLDSRISFRRLEWIIASDCDPVKYYEVLSRLLPLDRYGRAKNTLQMGLGYAALGFQNYELAQKHLSSVRLKKWTGAQDIRLLNLWGNFYSATGQEQEFEGCIRYLEQIRQTKRLGRQELMVLDRIEKMWERKKAMKAGDYDRVIRLAENALTWDVTQAERIFCYYDLGRAEWQKGHPEEAYDRFRYVAENGGTFAVRKDAEAMAKECRGN